MIDAITIDRIFDAAKIEEVVSDFVSLRKRGVNYVGLCPFHDDKTPSFYVSPSKGICKCFACGKGGNSVNFIMEHEQITYVEALKYLARKYGIEVKDKEMSQEERQAQSERESMFIVNEFARDWFIKQLKEGQEGKAVGMAYFRSRGFRDDIIEKFQLGYSPSDRSSLGNAAVKAGYNSEYLVKTGLCLQNEHGELRDRYFGRVIFPIHSISGKVIAFGGRVLASATKGVSVKYINSPESDIYHKSNELYGIYYAKSAIQKQDCCYLVEGYTDVISMHQSGIENVVASSGTALTDGQIKAIKRFSSRITVLYDGDDAGIHASLRGTNMLLAQGMSVKVCLLPDGEDPDSFAKSHSSEEFRKFISDHEVDFIRFKTDLLMKEADKDPIKKAELTKSIVQSISVIPDAIVRDVYIKECSQMMAMDERLIVSEVAKRREEERERAYEQRERDRMRQQRLEQMSGEPSATEGTEEDPAKPIEMGPDTQQSGEVQPQPPVKPASESYPYDKFEKMILRLIVLHGDRQLQFKQEDGSTVGISVINFIWDDLQNDGITFQNPLHKKILQEAYLQGQAEGFQAERFFLSHPDPEISQYCASLASSRYQLSNLYRKQQTVVEDKDRIEELVSNSLVSFKASIARSRILELQKQLQDPQVISNDELCANVIGELQSIQKVYQQASKMLGGRVINPL